MNIIELNDFLTSYTPLEISSREQYYKENSENGQAPPLPADIHYCSEETYRQKMVDRSCNIVVHRHERYHKCPYHNHQYIEFMYQYSGHTISSIEGKTMLLNPGDICILAPSVFHLPEIYDNSILINLIIQTNTFHRIFDQYFVDDNPLSEFARALHYNRSYPKYFLQCATGEEIRKPLCELMSEYFENDIYGDILIENLLITVFCHMIRTGINDMYVSAQCTSRVQPVLPILQYIHSNFQNIALSDLSEKFNYTPQHLCRMIKAHTGQTFNQHLLEIRISRARQLLISTDFSINRIASLSGFDCVTYFHRRFKEATGLSPQVYRNSMRSHIVYGPQNGFPAVEMPTGSDSDP